MTTSVNTIEVQDGTDEIIIQQAEVVGSITFEDLTDINVDLSTSANKLLAVSSDGTEIIATEDLEVPDTSLSNGQTTFYLDETSNTLTVKCKYSNGTVKTGTIALS